MKIRRIPGLRTRGAAAVLAAALALPAFLSGPACKPKPREAETAGRRFEDPAKSDRVVLEIEGRTFTSADFLRHVRRAVGDSLEEVGDEALSRIFDEFVDRRILLDRAAAQQIVLTPEEKATALGRFKTSLSGEPEGGVSSPDDETGLVEDRLAQKYLSRALGEIEVGPGEIAEYYTAHKADFLIPERVQVSQILVDTEGRAGENRDRIKSGDEAAFREAAKTSSAGPEAAKGGIMGVFSPGQLPPELEKVIFALQPGEVSQVVASSYGFHIFRLDRKLESRLLEPAEAAAEIRARLLSEKRKAAEAAHLAELKSRLAIAVHPENLPFAYQRTPS